MVTMRLFIEKILLRESFFKFSNHPIYLSVVVWFVAFLAGVNSFTLEAQTYISTPVDVGYRDFDFYSGGVLSTPTVEKPESKLWWNDGFWWGIMLVIKHIPETIFKKLSL